jgi:PAS domain S-box-containing protein
MKGGESRYGAGEFLAVPARHKDGHQISVEFTILPLHDSSGAILGIAAFLRDVTARFEEVRGLRRELAALKAQGSSAAGA